jgi:hypothetical protein
MCGRQMSLFGGPSGNISQLPTNTAKPPSDTHNPPIDDDSEDKMAPLVKRVKYVSACMVYYEESHTNNFHRYHLTDTFGILVGIAPNQQRFTVHHDLIT